jgi:hypothetical protein
MLSGPSTSEGQLDVLARIKKVVDVNVAELQLAYADRTISVIAWTGRNLLELAIWSEHCAASKENAKEFLLDAARDGYDVLDIPGGPVVINSLKPARQDLLDKTIGDGFDIEQENTRVFNAAKKLGRGDVFRYCNKIFSKYAHPTALVIFSDEEAALRKKMYELGTGFGQSALNILNDAGQRIWTEMQSSQ